MLKATVANKEYMHVARKVQTRSAHHATVTFSNIVYKTPKPYQRSYTKIVWENEFWKKACMECESHARGREKLKRIMCKPLRNVELELKLLKGEDGPARLFIETKETVALVISE